MQLAHVYYGVGYAPDALAVRAAKIFNVFEEEVKAVGIDTDSLNLRQGNITTRKDSKI